MLEADHLLEFSVISLRAPISGRIEDAAVREGWRQPGHLAIVIPECDFEKVRGATIDSATIGRSP